MGALLEAPAPGAGDVASVAPVVDPGASLVERVVAGDGGALAEVFDRHGRFVVGVAQKVTRDPALAEEVAQEVFTRLWTDPGAFDAGRGTLRAFLGVQAHRRAVDLVRRSVRREAREEAVAAPEPLEDGTDRTLLSEVVRQAIGRLPEEQRMAVELAFWHGQTHREVAATLGIAEGTAKSRLRLAQAKLAEWLAPLRLETA